MCIDCLAIPAAVDFRSGTEISVALTVMHSAPACGVKFNVGIGTDLVLFPDPAQLPVASDWKLGGG